MSRTKEMLNPQPTEQEPYTVDDYPYGWKVRTKAQYWVETTKHGQRVVFRTLNPKTQQWNKPKKGNYAEILVLYRNTENGHIENDGVSFAYCTEVDLNNFLTIFPEQNLTLYQRKQLTIFRAILRTRKHVKINIVTNPTPEQQKLIEENNKQTSEDLRKVFTHYYREEKEKE